MIFVSTGGKKGQPVSAFLGEWVSSGIEEVELSGGGYSASLLDDLTSWRNEVTFRVHNYFPPPEVPFVFNLGSLDAMNAQRSIDHAREAIRWAVALGSPVYSFHAGYMLDLQPNELGRKIQKRNVYERKDSLEAFTERVVELAEYARREGVELLIENNVLSFDNFQEFRLDPLLMTTPDECVNVMHDTPDNVNLLVDVAHLKVSAQTLGYDPVEMLHKCEEWISAYHLSDNDGSQDSNERVELDSWFWPYLKKDLDYYSLEVYRESIDILLEQRKLTLDKLKT